MYAILKGRKIEPVNSNCQTEMIRWSSWFQKYDERIVAQAEFGEILVSTVFLGMDHGFAGSTPLWFETIIFNGPYAGFMKRYPTYDEAESGHMRIALAVRTGTNPADLF